MTGSVISLLVASVICSVTQSSASSDTSAAGPSLPVTAEGTETQCSQHTVQVRAAPLKRDADYSSLIIAPKPHSAWIFWKFGQPLTISTDSVYISPLRLPSSPAHRVATGVAPMARGTVCIPSCHICSDSTFLRPESRKREQFSICSKASTDAPEILVEL